MVWYSYSYTNNLKFVRKLEQLITSCLSEHTTKAKLSLFKFAKTNAITSTYAVADLRGGGGGLGGLNPPPPLELPSKNLMCIEKRHHNMSRPTLCSYSTLSQAQPQTIGFKPPPPPLGCQVNMWRYHGLLFMVSIALVNARKTSLTGFKIAPKKSARRYAARTSK